MNARLLLPHVVSVATSLLARLHSRCGADILLQLQDIEVEQLRIHYESQIQELNVYIMEIVKEVGLECFRKTSVAELAVSMMLIIGYS